MALSQGASDSGGPSFDPWEALDGLPAMVAVATASGALVFVNKRVESFTGRSRQELVESGWVRVVHPSDLSRAIGNLGQILDSREPAHAELRLRRADGAFVWHNVCVEAFPSEAQEPQLVKAVAVDCHRLHEELDSLRAARQQAAELSGLRFLALQDVSTPLLLEMAVQALATGLSATLVVALRSDGDGGSAVLESAFGAPPEFQRSARVELARDGHFAFCLAQPPREVVAVYDLERDFRFAPDRILAQHKAKSGLTIVVQTAEGPWGLLGVFSQARRPFSESDAKFLIAVADTLSCALDRERRLSHLAGTASSLRETLAQREEFMETLSHELRTPASIIHALANVPLRRGLDVPPEERQAVLQDLFDASRRLTETLVVTSEGYRLQPGESIVTEPVNPAAAVASAVRLFKRVQDGHRVRVRAPKQPPLVAASMAQLEEVLLNLLSNAAKHTPQGTPIEIQVEPAGNEVLIRVIDSRFEPAGNEVLIRVIDSGPGIPEADLARVFDPHYRGRATAPGLGLGLTLCKRIIDSFGGKIWLENRPEGGLMATVSLSVVAAGTS